VATTTKSATVLSLPTGDAQVSQAEILSALSFALDLTEGAVPGHALRSCLLGMRLGQELGLPADRLASLYYSLMLKDVGCSSNAARLCQILGGGDERRVKAGVKLEDWTRPDRPRLSTLRLLWSSVLPGSNPLQRVAGIAKIGMTQHENNAEMIGLRCDRGAHILAKLGLGEEAAEAVRHLDEHWDGSGYPDRLTRRDIPQDARILAVAQHLDVFASEKGQETAIAVLRQRGSRWFDPELVRVAEHLHRAGSLWHQAVASTPQADTRCAVLDLAPDTVNRLQASDIDLICEAFADVVDAKSSFTYSHSLGVTQTAVRIAKQLGLSPDRYQLVNRAALLHDIGKLSVPNSVLDKPGKLDSAEWQVVFEHPRLTREILQRIRTFGELAAIAGAHHERLDGSGYPDRVTANQLSLEARIVAVADVYSALTEDRPYRAGLSHAVAVGIMAKETPHRLDAECCEALMVAVDHPQAPETASVA
jgi:putative nucleotidyltransferase with HDIG domain